MTINKNPPQNSWRVALIAYEGAWASTLYAIIDTLHYVNLRDGQQTFEWQIVTPSDQAVVSYSGQSIVGDCALANDQRFDWVILSHFWGDMAQAVHNNPQLVPWLKQQYANQSIVACINSGVLWVAEAGLLDGRRATAYWRQINELRQRYPAVEWLDKHGLVEDSGLYCCNGQNAVTDLILHLIEKFCGANTAAGVARDFASDSRRNYDLTLFNMAGFRNHRDDSIHRVQDWLEQFFGDPIEFQTIADTAGMSKSTFLRRFRQATGEKPTRYLQRLRIESAKHQLVNSGNSIKTISINVGYRDFGHFSKVFKQLAGVSPSQFRRSTRPRHHSQP